MPKFINVDGARALRFLAIIAGIAALYLGRDVLIPVALAVLLTFLLSPVVRHLQRLGLPRAAGVVVAVGVLAGVAGVIGYVVVEQGIDLADKLPNYKDNLRQKVRGLRQSGQGSMARISGTLHELKQELATSQPSTAGSAAVARIGNSQQPQPAATSPVKVELVDSENAITDMASSVVLPLLEPLGVAGITLLLLIFLLLHSDDVRERLIWIAGMRQMSLTTAALDEAADRIGGYLRMQLVVNLTYGVLVAIGLSLIGLPGAIMWGVIAGLLRFVPFLGPWIGAAMPFLLAVAVFPTWSQALAVLGWLAVCEILANTVLEPWLYGASTGMSSVGVVLAAVFWAWVWGPVGLILAVPITVCLVVLGKHVPQLALFNQLFGTGAGAMPQVARLYQRLLIGDESAADAIVSEELKEHTLVQVADQLLLPVLCELKRDHSAGLIAREQAREAIRTLELILPLPDAATSAASSEPCPRLLAVPGQGPIDEAAARLLARVANGGSIPAQALSSHVLASEAAARAVECNAAAVCIVQIAPVAPARARHILKTIESRLGGDQQVHFIELLVDGTCGSGADSPPGSPESPPSPDSARPSTTSGIAANVRRERGIRDLLEHLSDLRQTAPAAARAEATGEPSREESTKPKPEPVRT